MKTKFLSKMKMQNAKGENLGEDIDGLLYPVSKLLKDAGSEIDRARQELSKLILQEAKTRVNYGSADVERTINNLLKNAIIKINDAQNSTTRKLQEARNLVANECSNMMSRGLSKWQHK